MKIATHTCEKETTSYYQVKFPLINVNGYLFRFTSVDGEETPIFAFDNYGLRYAMVKAGIYSDKNLRIKIYEAMKYRNYALVAELLKPETKKRADKTYIASITNFGGNTSYLMGLMSHYDPSIPHTEVERMLEDAGLKDSIRFVYGDNFHKKWLLSSKFTGLEDERMSWFTRINNGMTGHCALSITTELNFDGYAWCAEPEGNTRHMNTERREQIVSLMKENFAASKEAEQVLKLKNTPVSVAYELLKGYSSTEFFQRISESNAKTVWALLDVITNFVNEKGYKTSSKRFINIICDGVLN